LLVLAGRDAWLNCQVLAWRPIVYIGLISYPLYLWHWPLLCFGQITEYDSVGARFAFMAASVVLAALTYEAIEKPIRRDRSTTPLVALIAGATLVAILGALVWTGVISPRSAAKPEVWKVAKAKGEWDFPGRQFKLFPFQNLPFWERGNASRKVLMFGDSLIEQYAPRLNFLLDTNPNQTKSVAFATLGGCPPIPNVRRVSHPHCDNFVEAAREFSRRPGIDTVVIGGIWSGYFTEGSNYFYFDDSSSAGAPLGLGGADKGYSALAQMMAEFRKEGKRVVLLLSPPTSLEFDPARMVRRDPADGKFELVVRPVDAKAMRQQLSAINNRLRAAALEAGADVIDPVEFLCDQSVCPSLAADGEPLYKDTMHLRPGFVRHNLLFLDDIVRLRD
jgi:SGNH domain-containing protein